MEVSYLDASRNSAFRAGTLAIASSHRCPSAGSAAAHTVSTSGVRADRGGGHRDTAAASGSLGEDTQLDAELDGRALHHPGQLAATDHADHREPPGVRRGASGGSGRALHGRRAYPWRDVRVRTASSGRS